MEYSQHKRALEEIVDEMIDWAQRDGQEPLEGRRPNLEDLIEFGDRQKGVFVFDAKSSKTYFLDARRAADFISDCSNDTKIDYNRRLLPQTGALLFELDSNGGADVNLLQPDEE